MTVEREIPSILMKNKAFSVLVWRWKFGQFRIILSDVTKPDPYAPPGHGRIVRELDTKDASKIEKVLWDLQHTENPADYCSALERPWNCKSPVDRILLDAKPKS